MTDGIASTGRGLPAWSAGRVPAPGGATRRAVRPDGGGTEGTGAPQVQSSGRHGPSPVLRRGGANRITPAGPLACPRAATRNEGAEGWPELHGAVATPWLPFTRQADIAREGQTSAARAAGRHRADGHSSRSEPCGAGAGPARIRGTKAPAHV